MAQEGVGHSLGIRYVESHGKAGQAFMQTRVRMHPPSSSPALRPLPGKTHHLLNYFNSKDFVDISHLILQEFIQIAIIIPNLQIGKTEV